MGSHLCSPLCVRHRKHLHTYPTLAYQEEYESNQKYTLVATGGSERNDVNHQKSYDET